MESSLTYAAVEPIRPPASYIGGKRNLARRLVDRIETIPHRTYAEPFVGMGGVFFRRRLRPQAEVVNDWSRDVATLYRVLQRHYVAFMDVLRWQITSRAEFERLLAVDADTLTDLERAARFLYLQRTGFGGKVTGRSFGVNARQHSPGRFDVTKLAGQLDEVHQRLSGVIVERLPWADFIRRYDGPEVLFYVDPPYWGAEHVYGEGLFAQEEFERLAGALHQLAGRFVLSLNDTPQVRRIFSAFELHEERHSWGISHGATPAAELVITNALGAARAVA